MIMSFLKYFIASKRLRYSSRSTRLVLVRISVFYIKLWLIMQLFFRLSSKRSQSILANYTTVESWITIILNKTVFLLFQKHRNLYILARRISAFKKFEFPLKQQTHCQQGVGSIGSSQISVACFPPIFYKDLGKFTLHPSIHGNAKCIKCFVDDGYS